MAKNQKKVKEVPCYFRADRDMLKLIDAMAKKERRTRSQMIGVLVLEGLQASDKTDFKETE